MRTVLPGYAVSGGLVGGCAPDMSWMLVTNCRKTRWPRWYVSVSAHGLNPQYNYFMQNINPETWTRIGEGFIHQLYILGKQNNRKNREIRILKARAVSLTWVVLSFLWPSFSCFSIFLKISFYFHSGSWSRNVHRILDEK